MRILVVDDNAMLRAITRAQIESFGDAQVYEADSGTAAYDMLEEVQPDVVVADFHMPACNGADLAEAMRLHPVYSQIPIVYLSGEPDELERHIMLATQPIALLNKPCEASEMQEALRRATRSSPRQSRSAGFQPRTPSGRWVLRMHEFPVPPSGSSES